MITDPNGQFVTVNGEKFYKYIVDYEFEGSIYCFEIWAKDNEEAQERIRAIRTTSVNFIQSCYTIEGGAAAGAMFKVLVWWKNFRRNIVAFIHFLFRW